MEQLVQLRSPSFVAFVLNMVPYLSHRFGASERCWWASRRRSAFSAPPFEPAVAFFRSRGRCLGGHDQRARSRPRPRIPQRPATYTKTETAGFYKALLTQPSHKTEIRNFAVNVDPAEGDLRALAGPDLASRLAPLKYEFEYAAKYDIETRRNPGPQSGRFVPADPLDRAHPGAMVRLVVQLPHFVAHDQPLESAVDVPGCREGGPA